MKLKYVAHYDANNTTEFFETIDNAKKWLEAMWSEDGSDEGYAEETMKGQDFIAKIEYVSKFVITDKKENYKENADGLLVNKNGDEWTFEENIDITGYVEFVKED